MCRAVSCPFLSRTAFTAENLEAQLQDLPRRFVNQRRIVTTDLVAGTLTLSTRFDWYASDFEAPPIGGGSKGSLIEYVRRYANDDNRWSLNEPGSRVQARSPLDRELTGTTTTIRPR